MDYLYQKKTLIAYFEYVYSNTKTPEPNYELKHKDALMDNYLSEDVAMVFRKK